MLIEYIRSLNQFQIPVHVSSESDLQQNSSLTFLWHNLGPSTALNIYVCLVWFISVRCNTITWHMWMLNNFITVHETNESEWYGFDVDIAVLF